MISSLISFMIGFQTVSTTPAFTQLLIGNSHQINIEAGKLSGPGHELLVKEAGASQFFMIGEEHGYAENPVIANALLQDLKPLKYRYFATEIGKYTTQWVDKLARSEGTHATLESIQKQFPFSLPFYNWKEEGELLDTAISLGKGSVWGIDQEFFMSPVMLTRRLRELARTPEEQKLAQKYQDQTATELKRMTEKKNPSLAFIVSATPEQFSELEKVFKNGHPEAKEIISLLKESAAIYQLNMQGKLYENNFRRGVHLRENFMKHYAPFMKKGEKPKVFFKFGAAHITRGRSYVNTFDLGNFISELAYSQGTKSFHLLIMGVEGRYNKYVPFGSREEDKRMPYSLKNAFFYGDFAELGNLVKPGEMKLVDLRPIRARLGSRALGVLPKAIEDTIVGFDAVVLVHTVTPTTIYGDR